MMTSQEILIQMREAIAEFGRYSYEDKGPQEVMSLRPIEKALMAMPAEEARKILEEVHADGSDGEQLAASLVCNLDDQPEEWFDVLLESDTLSNLY